MSPQMPTRPARRVRALAAASPRTSDVGPSASTQRSGLTIATQPSGTRRGSSASSSASSRCAGGARCRRLRSLAPLPHPPPAPCQRCSSSAGMPVDGSTPKPISAHCSPSASSLRIGPPPVAGRTQPCGSMAPARSRSLPRTRQNRPSIEGVLRLDLQVLEQRAAGRQQAQQAHQPVHGERGGAVLRHHERTEHARQADDLPGVGPSLGVVAVEHAFVRLAAARPRRASRRDWPRRAGRRPVPGRRRAA